MPLRIKVLSLVLAVAAMAGAYLVLSWIPSVERNAVERVKAVTESHLDTVVESLVPFLIQGQYASVNESLDILKERNPDWARLELYSWNGLRIYPVVAVESGLLGLESLNVFEREISVQGTNLGRLLLSADLEAALQERRSEAYELAWVLGGAFLIVLFGTAVLLEIWVRRPVDELVFAAQQLSDGAFDVKLPAPSHDEIGALVKTFGEMRVSLRDGQKALMRNEERFRDFGASAADWYWEMDEDLRFSYFSDRFTEVTGVPQGALLGKTREETGLPGLDEETWQTHLDTLHAHRPFRNFVHPRDMPHGSQVWLSINGRPFFDDDGAFKGYRGTGVDITEAKMAVLNLERAKLEAERALKQAEEASQAKTLFLSSMSHELRTPLNAILGFGQILKLGDLGAKQVEPIEQILKSGSHLLELINQVLDLSRIDSGAITLSIENVRARDVVNQCVDMARTLGDKVGVSIVDATQGQDLPYVRADMTRLTQALLNLLSNAVKYNRSGGEVTLETLPQGNMLRFSVRDQGEGIAEHLHGKLFEPFNRLGAEASNIEGTGIGLSITKELVELMDGRIGLESRVGHGSTFWIDMPVTANAPQSRENWGKTAKRATEDLNAMGRPGVVQVLYVEDNPANANLMDAVFDELDDFELICVGSAEDALARLDQALPDLVLMDIDLPGMKGDDALKVMQTRPDTRDIPVIAVSADAMPASINRAMRLGFRDYITKPFDITRVVEAVNAAVS